MDVFMLTLIYFSERSGVDCLPVGENGIGDQNLYLR